MVQKNVSWTREEKNLSQHSLLVATLPNGPEIHTLLSLLSLNISVVVKLNSNKCLANFAPFLFSMVTREKRPEQRFKRSQLRANISIKLAWQF